MSSYGFIYVMENRAMPGIYKIGMTTRSPAARAAELSSATGVPENFVVIYYAEVESPAMVETMIHQLFSDARVSNNREFFRVNPAEIACALYEHALSCWMDTPVALAVRALAAAEDQQVKGVTLQ